MELGVDKEWSIPMYYRHLSDHPKSDELKNILILVEKIGRHQSIFVPFALARVSDKSTRNSALWYIWEFGNSKHAGAVAAHLLDPAFQDEDPRVVFECLKKIGGKDELAILMKFSAKNFARNRKPLFVTETDACRKAIESRLEAEAIAAALKK